MKNKTFTLPKHFKDLTQLPISAEVMSLEIELEKLMAQPNHNVFEKELVKYLFGRCNKLWHKLKRRDVR